jgi:hypothetical protein
VSPAKKLRFPTMRDMAKGTLRAILREAGIDVKGFLKA